MTDLTGEAELLRRSRSGDKSAFGQIVTRYQNLVCSVCYSVTGNLALSEEAAQEAFIVAWRKLADLRELGKFRPWLCSLARNVARSVRRRQKRSCASRTVPADVAEGVASRQPGPPEQALSKEKEAILWEAVESLDEKYREVVVLFYRERESTRRVAELLDLPESTVRSRVFRARKMLEGSLASFVRDTLRKTAPSEGFGALVVAMLPLSALQATGGAAAATTAAAATDTLDTILHKCSRLFLRFLLLPTILVHLAFVFRKEHSSALSPSEKRVIKLFWISIFPLCFAVGFGSFFAYAWLARPGGLLSGVRLPVNLVMAVPMFAVCLCMRHLKEAKIRRIRAREGRPSEPPCRKTSWRDWLAGAILAIPLAALSLVALAAGDTRLSIVYGFCVLILWQGIARSFCKAADPVRHLAVRTWMCAGLIFLVWSHAWPAFAEALAARTSTATFASLPLWGVTAFWLTYLAAAYVLLRRSYTSPSPAS